MLFDEMKLSNGAELYFHSVDSPVTYIDFIFSMKGKTLPQRIEQTAHLLEHVMSNPYHPLKDKGLNVNASTNQSYIEFHAEAPTAYTPDLLKIYSDSLFNCSLVTEDVIKKEIGVVRAENKMRESRSTIRLFHLETSTLLSSPINSANATSSLDNITANDVLELYDELIRPENLTIITCGNIESYLPEIECTVGAAHTAKDGLSKILEKLANEDFNNDVIDQVPDESGQAYFEQVTLLPELSRKDIWTYQVIQRIFREDSSDSFYSAYRSRGLAYSLAFAPNWRLSPGRPLYLLTGVAAKQNIGEIVELFNEKLEDIAELHFSSRPDDVKHAVKNTFVIRAQRPSDVVAHGRFMWQLDGSPDDDLSLIDTITAEDIVRCARNILDSPQRKLFMVKY